MDKKLESGYRDLLGQVFSGRSSDKAGEDQSNQQPPEPLKMPGKSSENLDFRKLPPKGMSQELYNAYLRTVHTLPGGWDNN